jgi:hypothetical protein
MFARETKIRRDSRLFTEMCAALVKEGHKIQFRAHGQSMSPNLADGDEIVVAPVAQSELRFGDIALIQNLEGLRVHRVVSTDHIERTFSTQSDTGMEPDLPALRLYGKVVGRRNGTEESITKW